MEDAIDATKVKHFYLPSFSFIFLIVFLLAASTSFTLRRNHLTFNNESIPHQKSLTAQLYYHIFSPVANSSRPLNRNNEDSLIQG